MFQFWLHKNEQKSSTILQFNAFIQKTSKNSLEAISKTLENSPKVRHNYMDGKLWVFGIGNLYECKKTCEKLREKKYEKLQGFKFFDKIFFGNVPKYDFKNIIESV